MVQEREQLAGGCGCGGGELQACRYSLFLSLQDKQQASMPNHPPRTESRQPSLSCEHKHCNKTNKHASTPPAALFWSQHRPPLVCTCAHCSSSDQTRHSDGSRYPHHVHQIPAHMRSVLPLHIGRSTVFLTSAVLRLIPKLASLSPRAQRFRFKRRGS